VPSSSLILEAISSCPEVRALAARLPTPGQTATLGGTVGSLASAVVAALHREHPGRVLIAVAETPQDAVAAQADMEAVLDREGESYLYPQKEALPYE
jgi:hypothetical protein